MSDIATGPAQDGDTADTLWLKIAVAFQTYAGTPGSGGDIRTGKPKLGDKSGNILKAAVAAQSHV